MQNIWLFHLNFPGAWAGEVDNYNSNMISPYHVKLEGDNLVICTQNEGDNPKNPPIDRWISYGLFHWNSGITPGIHLLIGGFPRGYSTEIPE